MLLPALYSSRKSIAYSRDGIEMDGHGFWVDLCRCISLFSGRFTFLRLELRYLGAKTSELWGWGQIGIKYPWTADLGRVSKKAYRGLASPPTPTQCNGGQYFRKDSYKKSPKDDFFVVCTCPCAGLDTIEDFVCSCSPFQLGWCCRGGWWHHNFDCDVVA